MNDRLRTKGRGGRIFVTDGVSSLSTFDPLVLLRAIADYDRFDEDNNPHGERDFGALELFGTRLLWKIDYYDLKVEFGSENPADPDVTTRVLTVMLPHEY